MARQRILDIDRAMQTATDFFWRYGYERTSVADLTKAMGVTPPSFYFAFGSKDGLFLKVLEDYHRTRLNLAETALNEPTAYQVADVMLHRLADLYTEAGFPPGCLAVNCRMAGIDAPGPLRDEIAKLRSGRRARLANRLQQAQELGDLPDDADPDELAGYLMTIGWGMAIDAQSGSSRKQLYATVARALKAWPK